VGLEEDGWRHDLGSLPAAAAAVPGGLLSRCRTRGGFPAAAGKRDRSEHHLKLYRFSPQDCKEIVAVFTGPHPETGEPLEVVDEPPEGALPNDLPGQPAVFAPDYAPEEIRAIADKLRKKAGLPDEPLGEVANPGNGKSTVKKAARKAKSKVT
jgi:hypothetical protein